MVCSGEPDKLTVRDKNLFADAPGVQQLPGYQVVKGPDGNGELVGGFLAVV
jgi:hypothetical protein